MGNFLRILLNDQPSKSSENLFVDFENVKPTESEAAVYASVQNVLNSSEEILQDLERYRGATDEIRQAISNPSKSDLQEKAWSTVLPLVCKLKEFFDFSLELERVIPDLLKELCTGEMSAREHIEHKQALFKQFAEILDFVLKFDDLKMTTPAIQNDFSYYRRMLNKPLPEGGQREAPVSSEMANRMSLFYADPTPMLKALSQILTQFVTQNKQLPVEHTTDCLSMMANICRVMIENPEFRSRLRDDTKLFCLRVMVGVIILYDHVHPVGAFAKGSGIEVKSCIRILKEQERGKAETLLNALRYSTKHLQDESTPKTIKAMLEN